MKKFEALVKAHYPQAAAGDEVTEKYLEFLSRNYDVNLDRTLFATSLCSDDINVSTDFRQVLTRPFTMGGLGGLPYSGFTGMVAYGHHIPDGGDAFIFYGPHIGITEEGELGKMQRPGQAHLTNSCGALMLALERLASPNDVYVPESADWDFQQAMLERVVMPYKNEILASKDPKKAITDAAYTEIHKTINRLVLQASSEFHCKRVFLLGGVIINTSPGYNDAVDIRNFDMVVVGSEQSPSSSHSILQTDAFKNL